MSEEHSGAGESWASALEEGVSGKWYLWEERTVLRVVGPDSERFLDGQVSNSVGRAKDGSAVPACLCNVKGRVEALVWLTWREDAWWVDGCFSQRDQILARLDRYLIADDCEIQDETGQWHLYHRFGAPGGGIPSRRIAQQEGGDFWVKATEPGPDWTRQEGVMRLTEEEWQRLTALSLLPLPGREINTDTFPSEIGLDHWAVDFHKGCYLGQEIVSRLKSVGSAKRQLLTTISALPLLSGQGLKAPGGLEGVATRDSVPWAEHGHVGVGIFKKKPGTIGPGPVRVEAVRAGEEPA